MKTPTKAQQTLWAKGQALYDDFIECVSLIHEPNAHKIARTPRTNTLESFVSAKDQRSRNMLMLAEYQSNTPSEPSGQK